MAWLNKGIDFLALLFAVLFFPVPIYWLIIHPAIHFWRRFGNRSFLVALPLWVFSGVALVLLRHQLFTTRIGQNAITWVLGSSFVIAGVWISRLVHHELGLPRLVGLPEIIPDRYPGGVVKSGMYARVRHPRYLGLMLVFLGLALLTAAVGFFLLAIVTILLYYIVAPLEERELREQYGAQYEVYAQTVPRFLPRLGRKIKPQEL